jgi:hypothetical protein
VEAFRSVLSPGTPRNRMLRAALVVLAIGSSLRLFVVLLEVHPKGVDIVIPLNAAERWVAGGLPYLASSFQQPPGYDLPFLYPPPVLPLVAPMLVLPRIVVVAVWMCIGLAAAVAALDRLAIPWRWIAIVLIWPPFAEAILGGNLQTVLFLAFVLLYVGPRSSSRPWQPAAQDPRTSTRPAVVDGALAAAIGALKLSQGYAWMNLLRRRPRAAIAGAALVVLVTLLTLPLVGVGTWRDWLEQLGRAADPSWAVGGFGLESLFFPTLRPVLLVAGLVLAFLAPADDAGASVGAVLVVFGQSLRMFGLVFLVPAMLRIRVEIALVGAFLAATYTAAGIWLAIGIVVGAHVASRWVPALREPDRDAGPGLGASAGAVAAP